MGGMVFPNIAADMEGQSTPQSVDDSARYIGQNGLAPAYTPGSDISSATTQQVQAPTPKRGALKNLLMNMAQGAALAGGYESGIPQSQKLQADTNESNSRSDLYKAQTKQLTDSVQTPFGPMPASLWKAIAPSIIRGQSAENVANINQQGANSRTDKTLDSQESRSDNQISAQKDIAQKRLDSMRELTKMRLNQSLSIANGKNQTMLDAAKIRSTVPMMREGMKSYELALDTDSRLQQMQQQAADPNPAGDKALLFNHIAMTLGNVKGGRVTQAEIEAHLKARSLPDDVMQAWDKVTTGKTLTPEQRQNFLKLANEVRDSAWDKAYRRADFYGVMDAPEDNPVLAPAKTHVAKPGASKTRPPLSSFGK